MIKRQKNRKFELVSKFKPAGDQEQAIDKLTAGFKKGYKEKSYIIGWNIMYYYSCVFYL